jgi:hypothetical protein
VRHLDDLEAEPRSVGLDDLPHHRVDRLGEHDLRAPGRVLRDVARVGGDRGAVVAGRVRDVHAGQLADRRLVLEDRLQHALAHLGLVRRVGREELAAREHRVDDGRHVVVVHAGAEERQLRAGMRVARRELLEVAHQLGLGERRLQVEWAAQPHALGHLLEELLDRRDADRREHLLAVAVRDGEVAHCSARSSRYAAASSSVSTSA